MRRCNSARDAFMRRSQRRGDPVTAAGMNGDLAPMRDRGEIERWSTRSFGEYAFLEDSRYTSQEDYEGRFDVAEFLAFLTGDRAVCVESTT